MITDRSTQYTLMTGTSKSRAWWPREATSKDIATGLQLHHRQANAPCHSSYEPCS